MSTTAVISSIMSSQISDSLTRVNHLMSEIEDSFPSVLSPVEFLPKISELLQKMQNMVIMSMSDVSTDANKNDCDELWWDSSHECVAYSDENSSMVSTINFSTLSCSLSSSPSISSSSSSNQAIFIDNVLTFMSKVAPANVFSRQKSKRRKSRRMRRLLHPELFSIWYYSSQLMSDVSKKPAPLPPYPEVDWTSVNKRFLTNVPSPVQYPIHGCSKDEDFYVTKYARSEYGGMDNKGSSFTKDAPFGSLPGYWTNMGVINVPSGNVFHGYTWLENQGWVLHATMPTGQLKKRRIETRRGRKRK